MAQKDNASLFSKQALREALLCEIKAPVVMETHGGYGELYRRLYSSFRGVVFESNAKKVEHLAAQRPTWAVYECHAETALRGGVGFHLPVNFVDVDPYGEAWGVCEALFGNANHLPDRWALAVNDGLKRYLMLGRGWKSLAVKRFVGQLGNDGVVAEYLSICRILIDELAAEAGFWVSRWAVNSCGHGGQMTHFGAVLERGKAPSRAGGSV